MKTIALAVALTGLMATPLLAQQTKAPGQLMQDKGSVKGTTGASGYAPGQSNNRK